MLELMAFLILGAFVLGALALVGFLFKIVFKIVLIPVWIALGLVKLVFGLVAGIVGLVLAVVAIALVPVALLLFLFIGLPLLALAALVGLGGVLVTA